MQNTNVVELYSRLEKNKRQLTYYDSGIGTYVKESASLRHLWQVIDYTVDMAIAWYAAFSLAPHMMRVRPSSLISLVRFTGTSSE
jgi:uncharacterized protein (DUF2235 family)